MRLTERRKMEVNENRGRLGRKNFRGKSVKRGNRLKPRKSTSWHRRKKKEAQHHQSKHRLGVRLCLFLRLCGSRHTFVPNSFWAMVCRRTIPLLRKILMNEGIKKSGSLYQNLGLNSYFCIRRVL